MKPFFTSPATPSPKGTSSPKMVKGYKMNDRVLRAAVVAVAKSRTTPTIPERAITDATYEYQCKTCGKVFDIYQSITEKP